MKKYRQILSIFCIFSLISLSSGLKQILQVRVRGETEFEESNSVQDSVHNSFWMHLIDRMCLTGLWTFYTEKNFGIDSQNPEKTVRVMTLKSTIENELECIDTADLPISADQIKSIRRLGDKEGKFQLEFYPYSYFLGTPVVMSGDHFMLPNENNQNCPEEVVNCRFQDYIDRNKIKFKSFAFTGLTKKISLCPDVSCTEGTRVCLDDEQLTSNYVQSKVPDSENNWNSWPEEISRVYIHNSSILEITPEEICRNMVVRPQ